LTHRFSNRSAIRQAIRQQAQKREWQDIPVDRRIQILEQVSKVVEQVLEEARTREVLV
jgi:delta 1-pyrroline-5-carboxylate dehydrogenase